MAKENTEWRDDWWLLKCSGITAPSSTHGHDSPCHPLGLSQSQSDSDRNGTDLIKDRGEKRQLGLFRYFQRNLGFSKSSLQFWEDLDNSISFPPESLNFSSLTPSTSAWETETDNGGSTMLSSLFLSSKANLSIAVMKVGHEGMGYSNLFQTFIRPIAFIRP